MLAHELEVMVCKLEASLCTLQMGQCCKGISGYLKYICH